MGSSNSHDGGIINLIDAQLWSTICVRRAIKRLYSECKCVFLTNVFLLLANAFRLLRSHAKPSLSSSVLTAENRKVGRR